ncbi:MAG: UDP-N-acetylmuramate:L-alanyl-gamma-D-glutamyl-meso-diaminopimelate ligase [Gemmatimonadetes bacterium]|nr:UDP-N-acetylmuramate:L-alanyl-gamma-D-glutamyl-meso-diaminopimelate ligase [Gemmatimonadota bacterium]
MQPPPGSHVHLIAVCGTAMGSLAAMLAERGCRVTGSDAHTYPPMSDFLREAKVAVYEGFDAARLDPAPDLVVVGNAVSRGNPEVEATLDLRIPYTSLPELLRDAFLVSKRPLVVTGTHGKTTTTAMAARLLDAGGLDPSFLIAGIPQDFPRPYRLGSGGCFVIEGDEYDSAFFAKFPKFFFYRPDLLIVNNIEYDHADLYASLGEIERAFRHLLNTVPGNGLILANGDDPVTARLLPNAPAPVQTFGMGSTCRWRAAEVAQGRGRQRFSMLDGERVFGRFEIRLSGEHNLRNALGAAAAAAHLGVPAAAIAEGLSSFTGIRRRQELLGEFGGVTVIDDFAHHPTAVEQTLHGLREAWVPARLWAVFEPASATNARHVFEDRYLRAFAGADRVTLAAVPRPERARGDAPFSPERLVAGLNRGGCQAGFAPSKEEILELLCAEAAEGDLVVFMSNGGFGGVQRSFVDLLKQRAKESGKCPKV